MGSWNCEFQSWGKQNFILTQVQSTYSLLGNLTSACKVLSSIGTVLEYSKGHSMVLSSQQLQDVAEHGKTSELNSLGPISSLSVLL